MLSHFDLKKNYPNGDRYVGEATNGTVKDGKGTYSWAQTGAEYSGDWKKDVMHGKGTYKIPAPQGQQQPSTEQLGASAVAPTSLRHLSTQGFQYEGQFHQGERHGKGKCQFSAGANYEGDWLNGAMEGQGTLQGGPGDNFLRYQGTFQQGLRWGPRGICEYKPTRTGEGKGDCYEGQWKEDLRHGQGKISFGASGDTYEGIFSDDQLTGGGKLIVQATGEQYVGEVQRGEKHGTGSQSFPDGSCYEGAFSKSSRHGRGCFQGHGLYYEGNWYYNQMEGKAGLLQLEPTTRKSAALNGLIQYEGDFVSDQFQGLGAAAYVDQRRYEGEWASDKYHGRGLLCNLGSPFGKFGTYFGSFTSALAQGEGESFYSHVAQPPTKQKLLLSALPVGLPPPACPEAQLDRYKGNWNQDLPNGSGTWTWGAQGPRALSMTADGRMQKSETYTGDIQTGLPHGSGNWQYADGAKFKGEFLRGQRHGRGRMNYPNGDHYDGDWEEGLYHGHGIWGEYDTSNSYNGAWLKGLRNGPGVQIEYGKFHYNGEFRDDSRHGKGLMKRNNGTEYQGDFANGVYNGNGALSLPDGSTYKGQFQDGQCHGYVDTKLPNGNSYKGAYTLGAITGVGEMTYKNMDRYVGSFVEGVRSGRGTFHFAGEGTELECGWDKDVLHGEGVCKKRDGTKTVRTYDEGTMISERPLAEGNFEEELPSPVKNVAPAAVIEKPEGPQVDLPSVGSSPATSKAPSPDAPEPVPTRVTPPAQAAPVGGDVPSGGVVPMSLRPINSGSNLTAKVTEQQVRRSPSPPPLPRVASGLGATAGGGGPAPNTSGATASGIVQLDAQITQMEADLERACTEDQRRAFKKKLSLLRATRMREQRAFQSQVGEERK